MYKIEKREIKKVIICLILFLIIAISTSMYYGNKLLLGSLEEYDNDDVKYLRSAMTLIDTGKLTYNYPEEKTVFIMPGIIFALLPFVTIFGKMGGIIAFRIFSAIIQTFTLYVLYLLIKKVFKSEKIAFITLLLNLIYVSNIYVTTIMLSETIFLCLLINLIYICIHAVEERSIKYYIIGGIIWGLSILFKPIMLVFPANIFIIMLFNKYKVKEIFKYAFIPIAIAIVMLMPWWIRNYMSFGKFIPLTLSSGNPKLQGAFTDYNQDVDYLSKLDFSNIGNYGNEIENNNYETKKADIIIKYNFKNNFWNYIYWMTVGKTIKNFEYPFIWFSLYGIEYSTYFTIHDAFLALGFLGIIISMFNKRYKENYLKYLLMIIIVFFNVVHLPYYCFSRYVYPIMPIVIAFASVTIISFIQIIKDSVLKIKKIRGKK